MLPISTVLLSRVVMIDLTCQLVEILTHLGDGWLGIPEAGDYLG